MIREIRASLAKGLAGLNVTVWTFLPDDLNEIPCVVVRQPTMQPDVQLYAATVPVIVVGRRLNDEDAQIELDDLADAVVAAIRGPDVAVTTIEPGTVTVAELIHPAYSVTVAVGRVDCY